MPPTSKSDSFLSRLGFRRILAFAQLVLYVVLSAAGHYQVQRQLESQQPRLHPIAYQEDSGLSWTPPQPPEPPFPWKLAILINVPAALVGRVLSAVVIRHNSETYTLLFAAPFVPLLWYFIGRWLDYELHLLPRPRRSITRNIFCSLGIIIAAFGIFSSVVSYTHGTDAGRTQLYMTAVWSCLILLMSVTALLRPNSKLPQFTNLPHE